MSLKSLNLGETFLLISLPVLFQISTSADWTMAVAPRPVPTLAAPLFVRACPATNSGLTADPVTVSNNYTD